MKIKIEITKYVATQLGLDTSDKSIRKFKQIWWKNPRIKDHGGLRLTEEGYDSLIKVGIKSHHIKFDPIPDYTNQEIIWLDNFIDCPWYVTKKEIFVFSEKMAIQLVLFSGNIKKFAYAKAENLKNS
jgi:hypothetical protein